MLIVDEEAWRSDGPADGTLALRSGHPLARLHMGDQVGVGGQPLPYLGSHYEAASRASRSRRHREWKWASVGREAVSPLCCCSSARVAARSCLGGSLRWVMGDLGRGDLSRPPQFFLQERQPARQLASGHSRRWHVSLV